MNYMERMRPKFYDKKVWEFCWKEAESNKEWALNIVKTDLKWTNEASNSSLEMLGSYLYLNKHQLAKESYDYLKMRAFGQTFLGALDDHARDKWETISGKKVNINKTWKYDHNIGRTSAIEIGRKWL